jgi:uncharacterized membrane protein
MARFCANCGNQMQDADAVCSKCGKPAGASVGGGAAAAPAKAPAAAGGLADNVAGMLAYVTIIPAIIFLVMEPYNKNKFVRFHSFQCLFLAVASIAVSIALSIISVVPVIGWAIGLLIGLVLPLAFLVLWVLLLIKAYQGQMWKVPFIGDLAEKQANA